MATYIATFDSVAKTLTVTEDGAPVENIASAEFYLKPSYGYDADEDEAPGYSMCLTVAYRDKDNKTARMERVCASEQAEAGAAPGPAPNLRAAARPLGEAIAEYMGR